MTRKDDLCDSQNNYLSEREDDSDNESIQNEINAQHFNYLDDGSSDNGDHDDFEPFKVSKRDIEDPYHELEYSEDDEKDYMGKNSYREKFDVKRRENCIIQIGSSSEK